MGFQANRPWLHRLKYGVSSRLPPEMRPPPSATFVSVPSVGADDSVRDRALLFAQQIVLANEEMARGG